MTSEEEGRRGSHPGRPPIHYFGTFPPYRGGIAQHAAAVVGALRNSGYRVVTTSWASQYPRWLYKGHQPTPTELESAGGLANYVVRWWNPWGWWRVGRNARHGQGLIEQWVTPFHAFSVVLSAWAARPTPTILIVHNIETHEWFPVRKTLTRLALRSVSAVLVHSTAVGSQVTELASRTKVVHTPMPDLLEIRGSPLPSLDPLRLLMVGYVRPYKGLEVALDAVARLVEQQQMAVRLTVLGEFWEPTANEAARMVGERGLVDYVDLRPGYVEDSELAAAISEHHLILMPYLTATQSAITPLAHAANRPVIASRLPGLSEQVRDGVDGILFEPGSAGALAEAVLQAASRLDELHQGTANRLQGAEALVQTLGRLLELRDERK